MKASNINRLIFLYSSWRISVVECLRLRTYIRSIDTRLYVIHRMESCMYVETICLLLLLIYSILVYFPLEILCHSSVVFYAYTEGLLHNTIYTWVFLLIGVLWATDGSFVWVKKSLLSDLLCSKCRILWSLQKLWMLFVMKCLVVFFSK